MDKHSSDKKRYFFDKSENVEKLLKVFYVVCGLLFILDFVIHRHISTNWEKLPGFYALYGFVAFVVLVVISHLLRRLLMRKEDYYDVDE